MVALAARSVEQSSLHHTIFNGVAWYIFSKDIECLNHTTDWFDLLLFLLNVEICRFHRAQEH